MKTSTVLVPVVFIALLFVIVLPRLIRSHTASAQVLPPTSSIPAAMPEPRVYVRPITSSQAAGDVAAPFAADEQTAALAADLTGLGEFAAPYLNGRADEVVVVAVDGLFTLPVVQQPVSQPAFVSSEQDVLTQFGLPRQYGTTGLLAHNFLSGSLFSEITEGDIVTVVRGDGSADRFQVSRIESFQALSSNSPYSQFIDLSDPSRQPMSSATLFNRIYTVPEQLVFQTCIAADGDPSWGRLFITASRIGSASPVLSIQNN